MWHKYDGVAEYDGKRLYVHIGWYQILALFMSKFKYNRDFTIVALKLGRLNKRLEIDMVLLGISLFANLYIPFLGGKTDEEEKDAFERLLGDRYAK